MGEKASSLFRVNVTNPCCGLAVVFCSFILHLIGLEAINIPEIFSDVHGFMGKTVKPNIKEKSITKLKRTFPMGNEGFKLANLHERDIRAHYTEFSYALYLWVNLFLYLLFHCFILKIGTSDTGNNKALYGIWLPLVIFS